jgi:hypothetical protein
VTRGSTSPRLRAAEHLLVGLMAGPAAFKWNPKSG